MMVMLKCDLCGDPVGCDGRPREPDKETVNGAMRDYLICCECAIDYLGWLDEGGRLTAVGRKLKRAGWLGRVRGADDGRKSA